MRVAGLTAYDFTSRGRSRVLGNRESMELGMGREMLFKLASWHWHIVLVLTARDFWLVFWVFHVISKVLLVLFS